MHLHTTGPYFTMCILEANLLGRAIAVGILLMQTEEASQHLSHLRDALVDRAA